MSDHASLPLLVGAIFNFLAALLHFACIPWGANGFKCLGAGEPIVGLAAAGHWYPSFIALLIGTMLMLWGVYDLSGAGLAPALPYQRVILLGITGVYVLRALFFPFLKPLFKGNTPLFWWLSSALCLLAGVLHGLGVGLRWPVL